MKVLCGIWQLGHSGCLLCPPCWRSRERAPPLSPGQGPFIGEEVQKAPQAKAARKCRNLARSGEVLAGLQGACACSERSHFEGAQSRLNRRGVGKRARLSWSGHVGSGMRPGVTPLVGAFSENHWATCQGLCEVTRICRGGKGSISGDPAVPIGHQSP